MLVTLAAFILCLITTLSLCALISDGGDAPPTATMGSAAANDPGGDSLIAQAVTG